MKFWISKNSEVSVRDQLVAQITLAIASGDLGIGEKLPSTGEIGRRFGIHSNTVGSAYRSLAEQRLIEFRQGSGFFVAESAPEHLQGTRRLIELVGSLFESAKALGFSEQDVISQVSRFRSRDTAKHLVLVESDASLRAVILHELSPPFPNIVPVSVENFLGGEYPRPAVLTAMVDEKAKMDGHLGPGEKCVYLKGRSAASAMSGEQRPLSNELVAVVSGWNDFLNFARIMLLAAKVPPGNLIVRSTAEGGWQEAIQRATIIVCDSLTAEVLGDRPGVRAFQLVSEESLDELHAALSQARVS